MPSRHETVICVYHYDPLDRITSVSPKKTTESQRFYCKSRIATEIEGLMSRSIFQHDDQLLSQQNKQDSVVTSVLLGTDQQRSVLNAVSTNESGLIAYSPYGHRAVSSGILSLLAFNGERRDPVTGCYLLGNGYRAFNPFLMRFISPDSWSPFGKGGLNAYAYCEGNPISRVDPTGHGLLSSVISRLSQAVDPITRTPGFKISNDLETALSKTLIKSGGADKINPTSKMTIEQVLIEETAKRSMKKITFTIEILEQEGLAAFNMGKKTKTIEDLRQNINKHNLIIGELKYAGAGDLDDRVLRFIDYTQSDVNNFNTGKKRQLPTRLLFKAINSEANNYPSKLYRPTGRECGASLFHRATNQQAISARYR